MAINTAVFAADVAAVIADLPDSIKWRGQTLAVASSDFAQGNALDMTGMQLVPDVQFLVAAAAFTSARVIAANDVVEWRGVEYRAETVTRSPCGTAYIARCVAKSK